MRTSKEVTRIPKEVYEAVVNRDKVNDYSVCVYCGRPARDDTGEGLECHHFIPRSLGGMGIEQNLVMLCGKCHRKIHNGNVELNQFVREYLNVRYEEWSEDQVIWRK